MTKIFLFFLTSFLCVLSVKAQKEIIIDQYKYYGPITVNKPLMINKTDVNSNTFETKNLLQTEIDLQALNTSNKTLHTDSTGFITFSQDSAHQDFHLLGFCINADRYANAQLEISGMKPFNVFVDGKKEGANTYTAKDIDDIEPVYVNLTLEPRQYNITIQYLTGGKVDSLCLKSQLNKRDTITRFTVLPDGKRRLTLHDIIDGKRVYDASLSPSGKYYTISYRCFYPTEKSYVYHELRDMKDNRLIYRFPSSEKPFWMPTSDLVCYWRQGEEEKDLIQINLQNMQETVLAGNLDVESIDIAPNEQYMIVGKKDKAPVGSGAFKRMKEPDDRISGYRDRLSLYRYTFADKTLERITFGETDTYLADISQDSKKILINTNVRDLSERPFSKSSFYIINTSDLKADTLLQNNSFVRNACFSPDGKKVLFTGTPEAFGKIGENILSGQISNGYDIQAFIMDLETNDIKPITRNFDPSISGMRWSAWDNKIYFRCIDEDRESMYRYNPQSDVFERLPLAEEVIEKFSLSDKTGTAIYIGQSVSNSFRLHATNLKSLKSRLIADPMGETLSRISLGEVKEFNFISKSRNEIKGRYYLPADFDPNKQYPMIVYYYGGTTPTARKFESQYPLHLYAAMGYVVYTLQPSGTIGFGQEFSARHVNGWGQQTAEDIIEGTLQFCDSNKFVNRSKIGCIGASYGGFMTQYLQTKTNIFTAAVSHAGISNIASYWGEGYWGYSYSAIATADSYPWNRPELYVEQSPLFHADKINTPLLLLHGSADTNVPVGESIQMFNALKILGKPVELIMVEGENHGISSYKKRIEWNNSIFAWFAKWLKNEPQWWNAMYP